ncbi:hypothetical protein V8E54_003034 [Elaphomyces granulatus]
MARSFRDLIDFLLAEIALCGDQGASPSDLLAFVDAFYSSSPREQRPYKLDALSRRKPVIDRRFQERVWTWLTKNPEVSVGKKREGNGLSLSEAEAGQLSPADISDEEITSKAPDSQAPASPVQNGSLRVFVSEERTWLAITGHKPDESRVYPTEFALLSIIASRKSEGIVQTDLVKLSGQDKRSVPKRTEMLQRKGYIEKRAVQVKASRTSLCTLRKFVLDRPAFSTTETPPERGAGTKHETGDVIDFKVFTDRLFEVLREFKVISRYDLKKILGFADGWRWRILSRALQKFERIGCVQRVRAMSQYDDTGKALHSCVMLTRDPSERDIQFFLDNSRNLFSNLNQEDGTNHELDDDIEADAVRRESSAVHHVRTLEGVKEEVMDGGRILPQWMPDRNLHNLIFDVIDGAGTAGRTNSDTIRICFGGFVRRPLENVLCRLVECWQMSQPPHLRHLALVRDTALNRTITHYIHYSAKNFRKLVESGQASWEAVEFVAKDSQSATLVVPPVDAQVVLDAYGLPLIDPTPNLVKNGNATLLECMAAAKPTDYIQSSSDPIAVKQADGTYKIERGRKKTAPREHRQVSDPANGLDGDGIDGDLQINVKAQKLTKKNPAGFEGMSEKAILEALGLDETWTEYSVFLIDRPHPGVYVTPRGRRRPTGKRSGRPRISRIAVFKSSKLRSLPWFVETRLKTEDILGLRRPSIEVERLAADLSSTDDDLSISATPQSRPLLGRETRHQPLAPTRSKKRRHQGEGDTTNPREISTTVTTTGRRGRPPKRPRHSSPSSRVQGKAISINERLQYNATHVPAEQTHQTSLSEKVIASPMSSRNVEKQTTATEEAHYETGSRKAPNKRPLKDSALDPDESGKQPPMKRPRRSLNSKTTASLSTPARQPGASHAGIDKVEGRSQIIQVVIENPASSITSLVGSGRPIVSVTSEMHPKRVSDGQALLELRESPEMIDAQLSKTDVSHDATNASGTTSYEPPARQFQRPACIENSEKEATSILPLTELQTEIASNITHTPTAQESTSAKPKKTTVERGGSVAVLRRKIVLEILDKCGGAFPLGNELWVPFTTAWSKARHTEKPDLRTIRSTVKALVDAGKLRQLTFSGKDNKGVMITKSIVTMPEIPPDDPLVREMRAQMLALHPRHYIPPNADIDATVTKSSKNPSRVPIEPNVTVQLQYKPAWVVARDKRRGRQLIGSGEPLVGKSGVVRLRKLQLLQNVGSSLGGSASTFRSGASKGKRSSSQPRLVAGQGTQDDQVTARSRNNGHSNNVGRPKRLWGLVSSMAPHAMLMNTKQTFYPTNGTFGTNAGLATKIKATSLKRKPVSSLPRSLDDLLSQSEQDQTNFTGSPDPWSSKFFLDNDTISRWELQNKDLFDMKSRELIYINQKVHGPFEALPLEGRIEFDVDKTPPPQPAPPAPPMVTRQAHHPLMRTIQPAKPRSTNDIESQGPPTQCRPPSGPVQASNYRCLTKLSEPISTKELEKPSCQQSANRPTIRRNRFLRTMPQNLIRKIKVAIVVIRALVGGIEGKMVDWALFSSVFPEFDPGFIQGRGKAILSKNRLQMAKMQSDFQERYAEAYETGQVPGIDYDNLEAYDWKSIVDWADSQLDVPISMKGPDLPATREQFDSLFEVREEPSTTLDELYVPNASVTISRKRTLFASIPFAVSLEEKLQNVTSKKNHLLCLETAKTWVRANVMAPDETYNPDEARKALERLREPLVSEAVDCLVAERVISMGNRGRITPGRNYDMSGSFVVTLGRKRPLDSGMLKRAAHFKTATLDADFQKTGVSDIKYHAEDGDILAIINLAAEGRITLMPRNPPRDKYGLTDGGYLTRLMDKEKLRFDVEIRPVDGAYIYGNPLKAMVSTVPPPRGDMDLGIHSVIPFISGPTPAPSPSLQHGVFPGRVPIWYDIHFHFIKTIWDSVVATVVGCVAVRPGISAAAIACMINPTMGAWEVELLLEWLTEVRVLRRTEAGEYQSLTPERRPGWVVNEWWWLVIS